ncbi:MAG: hypothetical protein LUC18_03545 [Porphyromonadaceae bacterium]|nr:hypothetical protein [Porphyromonadaceae bacterium]
MVLEFHSPVSLSVWYGSHSGFWAAAIVVMNPAGLVEYSAISASCLFLSSFSVSRITGARCRLK